MGDFRLYHTSRSALAQDITTLVTKYISKDISEQELQEIVHSWSEKCPNLLFDTEKGEMQTISPKLQRLIGKKRALLIFRALEDARTQRNT